VREPPCYTSSVDLGGLARTCYQIRMQADLGIGVNATNPWRRCLSRELRLILPYSSWYATIAPRTSLRPGETCRKCRLSGMMRVIAM
jgi:hypothetical protein